MTLRIFSPLTPKLSPARARKFANGTSFESLSTTVEKGFAAAKDDIADLKHELKSDIAAVHEQVNSIEAQIKHGRYETRLGNL